MVAHREVRARLPRWYRGRIHAGLHFAVIGGVSAAAGAALVAVSPALWLAVPPLVPTWGVLEYFVHRTLLHGSSVWRGLARDHGTHHVYFPAADMFVDAEADVYRVLLRPQDVLAIEVFIAWVGGALLGLVGAGPALLVATSANLYLLLYELAHAAAHVESVADRPVVRVLARHHRVHHADVDARRNFAIVFPFVDRWFGTAR